MNPTEPSQLGRQALAIWQAAVDAARPQDLIHQAFADPGLPIHTAVSQAQRIIAVGAGKAGAAMSTGLEEVLADHLDQMEGIVNVPAECVRPLRAIRPHSARPAGTNQPTEEGVKGAEQILELVANAGPQDVGICLLSGGGSALLPAPVHGISLADKQTVTRLLHECGATINEMNAVRKHLSRIKGGRLAQAFHGRFLFTLIISDVIGDPLDVIASGPTAPDPSTFSDAMRVVEKYRLSTRIPATVLRYLKEAGGVAETPKKLPDTIHNFVIGNNAHALAAATIKAQELGYQVLNLGSFIEGETSQVATTLAGIVRSIRADGRPMAPPVCLLSGGETTVTLPEGHGLGGRNQEFVLAMAVKLGKGGLKNVVALSGGTDGEDGPTDAAGALAEEGTLEKADQLGLSPEECLARHDAYHFFAATGGLIKTGLTHTNVMDVRVILIQ
jgi:hydroxypyruvate reductase/glycerate 2-kinase